MKIKKKIVLIGMMGSGKSTIGALLSKKMNMKFVDLDLKIETIEKQTIKPEDVYVIDNNDNL